MKYFKIPYHLTQYEYLRYLSFIFFISPFGFFKTKPLVGLKVLIGREKPLSQQTCNFSTPFHTLPYLTYILYTLPTLYFFLSFFLSSLLSSFHSLPYFLLLFPDCYYIHTSISFSHFVSPRFVELIKKVQDHPLVLLGTYGQIYSASYDSDKPASSAMYM